MMVTQHMAITHRVVRLSPLPVVTTLAVITPPRVATSRGQRKPAQARPTRRLPGVSAFARPPRRAGRQLFDYRSPSDAATRVSPGLQNVLAVNRLCQSSSHDLDD